ncbi:MAG: chemotaxis protein CheA [Syntrophomonadaceae bacterium]|nr:chemotaxis protein CheA [Syntrophomonadaceae bacterium]
MDLSQYMDIFLIESKEHLLNLNQSLLELESNPHNKLILDEIFRAAHTLKGMASTMGFENVADLTHVMENVLTGLRNQEVTISNQLIDLLFQCLDSLQNMIESIEAGKSDNLPINQLIQLLQDAANGLNINEQPEIESSPIKLAAHELELNDYDVNMIVKAYQQGFKAYHIGIEVAPDSLMKSVRAFMVFKNLEEVGEIIKCNPPAQVLEEGNFENGFDLILITKEEAASITERVHTISEIKLAKCTLLELPPEEQGQENDDVKSDQARQTKDLTEDQPNSLRQPTKVRQTVRVDIERLDKLMNLVGELVINKPRLQQIGQANNLIELNETVEQFDRISTDLQNLVMKVRMVPVEQVFNRFPRMVRDLAKDLGKEIRFVIEGKETELDRTVIDEIGDPLVHLLRNSIDHGIESSEARRAAGKSSEGFVRLVARHEGNNVIIEVEDDGRGIDPERVRARAVALGLLNKDSDLADDNSILNFIFQPGFSTAEQITELSGRGVGLDVVRSKIEALSGTVTVESKLGAGTKFKVRLPLTLAIIQALLINVAQETYAIPLSAVDETVAITPENIKQVQNQEVVVLRGKVLPVIRLHNLLNIADRINGERVLYVVIVRKGDKQAGLIVDSLIGQQEIVIKSLGKLLTGIPGLAGATILGNGEVSLILDVGTLF